MLQNIHGTSKRANNKEAKKPPSELKFNRGIHDTIITDFKNTQLRQHKQINFHYFVIIARFYK